ncbi:uracil-DNA glycosylase [Candidatus Woesearchaeota archaeon]|nr:MAG: uracil-DNA glycosylase [Candidatus Woesearchaeota archaeon]
MRQLTVYDIGNGELKVNALNSAKERCARCKRCTFWNNGKYVWGCGSLDADLMIIGEAPGFHESKTGVPFVGKAGKLLDKILNAAGFDRRDIYITNVVKHRPPHNRTPTATELKACREFIDTEIDVVKPKLIVVTGLTSAKYMLPNVKRISEVRGKVMKSGDGTVVIPTLHPAALLRGTEEEIRYKKRITWKDWKLITAVFDTLKDRRGVIKNG